MPCSITRAQWLSWLAWPAWWGCSGPVRTPTDVAVGLESPDGERFGARDGDVLDVGVVWGQAEEPLAHVAEADAPVNLHRGSRARGAN